MNFVYKLGGNNGADGAEMLGGKGRALNELKKSGFPVPDGFVINTAAFDNFLEFNKFSRSDDVTTGEFSLILLKEIFKYYGEMRPGSVAVRSSADIEDSCRQSFAGQFDTFLCVKKEGLLEAIKKCWQSLRNPRALIYSNNEKLSGKMAVVVQEMISSRISGVAFSANPVNGDKKTIVIEAVLGSNELLVQGSITPDYYVVNKDDFEITEKKICPQKEMLVIDGESGILKKISVNEEGQKLEDNDIKTVARAVAGIARAFDYSADVEWAFQNKKLYVLQGRPITTL